MQKPRNSGGVVRDVGAILEGLALHFLEAGAVFPREDVAHVEACVCDGDGFGGECYGFADVVGLAGVALAVLKERYGDVAIAMPASQSLFNEV